MCDFLHADINAGFPTKARRGHVWGPLHLEFARGCDVHNVGAGTLRSSARALRAFNHSALSFCPLSHSILQQQQKSR